MRTGMSHWKGAFIWVFVATFGFALPVATVAAPQVPVARAQAVLDRSVDYLKSQQKADGGWQNEKDRKSVV